MTRTIFIISILACSVIHAQSKEDKSAIRFTIDQFFTAMFSGDTVRLAGIIEPGATLTTVSSGQSGGNTITYSTRRSFFLAIRTLNPDMGLRECLYGWNMYVDSEAATVVCTYHFFAKHSYTHSGTDTFILRRTASGWSVISVSDTRFVLARPPKHECS